jgi:hypothetical protein
MCVVPEKTVISLSTDPGNRWPPWDTPLVEDLRGTSAPSSRLRTSIDAVMFASKTFLARRVQRRARLRNTIRKSTSGDLPGIATVRTSAFIAGRECHHRQGDQRLHLRFTSGERHDRAAMLHEVLLRGRLQILRRSLDAYTSYSLLIVSGVRLSAMNRASVPAIASLLSS